MSSGGEATGPARAAARVAAAAKVEAAMNAGEGAAAGEGCEPVDPEAVAEAAGLRYVHDTEPGITRRRAGKGWSYRTPKGTLVKDARTLERIKRLAIPPAWTDVWICTRADGHLQATGWDARKRKQYRYHPMWREVRDQAKFERVLEFGLALPDLRSRVSSDLSAPGLPRHKVVAAVVALLDRTLIRVGNEEYARTNESYGLTTLRDEHADISGSKVSFCFRAKGGQHRELVLSDKRLARIVRRCQEVPGQVLFQYVEDGQPRAVGSRDINAYLQDVTGGPYTAKDFRTWGASVQVAAELHRVEAASSETEAKRQAVAAIKSAAQLLTNTPAVCRASYVHPVVIEAHHAGELTQVSERDVRRVLATHPGLEYDEALLVHVLQQARDRADLPQLAARAS